MWIDYFNPDAKHFLFYALKHLKKTIHIDGIWLDMVEDNFNLKLKLNRMKWQITVVIIVQQAIILKLLLIQFPIKN